MRVQALGACHAECPWCAADFWRWLKARMGSMAKGTPAFAEAAATSVRP